MIKTKSRVVLKSVKKKKTHTQNITTNLRNKATKSKIKIKKKSEQTSQNHTMIAGKNTESILNADLADWKTKTNINLKRVTK